LQTLFGSVPETIEFKALSDKIKGFKGIFGRRE
jgi:hypothetical protein